MIGTLRKKIAAINAVSLGLVFFCAIVLIFVIGYSRIDNERDNRLQLALSFSGTEESFAERSVFDDVVLAKYNDETSSLTVFVGKNVTLDRIKIESYVKKIASASHSDGVDLGFGGLIKYKSEQIGDTLVVAINDLSASKTSILPYLFWVFTILLFGLISHVIISQVLAKVALNPIEENWAKQKRFVADASHELKTPLSVIMANTEIIASHPEETVQSQMKWIQNTRIEAKRMAELVASLLFLAKSDDGLQVAMASTDLSDCVGITALTYDAVFYENQKAFTYDVARDVTVYGNDGQLKQLVGILLDNANKYSVGSGNVRLSLEAGGKHALITVSNDSAELSAEQLSHLFDRFYTVDASRNKNNGGNGLGLAIAQTICQTHGGTVKATYADGRVTFTVTLPLFKPKK